MSALSVALRAALFAKIARRAVHRWRRDLLVTVGAIVTLALCGALALGFASWALYAALAETMSRGAAAGIVAGGFVLLGAVVLSILALVRRRQARRAPDYAAMVNLFSDLDLPKPSAGLLMAGGLAAGLLVGLSMLGKARGKSK